MMRNGTMRHRGIRWVAAAIMIVAAACSGDDSSADDENPDTGREVTSGETTDDETETAEPAGDPLFAGLDDTVALVTDTSGGGERPLLEWESVDGADHYSLYLYGPSGDVYWSWTGHDTAVHVGGEPRLDDGVPGPSVADGMSWSVLAHDAAGLPLAVSEQRAIAP